MGALGKLVGGPGPLREERGCGGIRIRVHLMHGSAFASGRCMACVLGCMTAGG